MNSIGRGSNAHGLAGVIGLLAFAVGGLPAAALTLLATRVLDRPWLAPLFVLLWCVVAFGLARWLFILAERTFENRREHLAMLL